jgi:hypothetical protein
LRAARLAVVSYALVERVSISRIALVEELHVNGAWTLDCVLDAKLDRVPVLHPVAVLP